MRRLFVISSAAALAALMASCFQPVVFEGTSMRPGIDDGDRIIVSTNIDKIGRGDVVMFRYLRDPEKFYIKRVIGMPGETLEIKGGEVLIDGVRLPEPYLEPDYNQQSSDISPLMIEKDHFFVMGDNRDNSSDSRYWGTVRREAVQGKFVRKY